MLYARGAVCFGLIDSAVIAASIVSALMVGSVARTARTADRVAFVIFLLQFSRGAVILMNR
jgi:hypothetical protein